jgi:dipeptidyl-peptidase-4
MTEYGEFQATRRIKPPAAYVLKPDQRKIIELLLMHGITVEETKADETLEVEQYVVTKVDRSGRAFQGHQEVRLTVKEGSGREAFPSGSFVVSMRQPKAALVFYLLEPESDDGLVNWNFFDEAIQPAAVQSGAGAEASQSKTPVVYPVYRVGALPAVPRQMLRR